MNKQFAKQVQNDVKTKWNPPKFGQRLFRNSPKC